MSYIRCLSLIVLLNLSSTFAGIEQAPPSFMINGKRAVWVDFTKAKYNLKFDIRKKRASSVSVIEFEVVEKGFPIFDLVRSPGNVSIDGISYSQNEVKTPDRASKVRIINKELAPGNYTLKVENNISSGVKFSRKDVSVGFFMSDLKDRNFLEKYIPSNYEYDQYKMEISLDILGARKSHRLFTNGSLVEKKNNSYRYTYPEYFTSSSLYLHLVPESKFDTIDFTYESKLANGRNFPVTIYSYSKSLNRKLKEETISVLNELESDYGAWPHSHLILYGTGYNKGGMEYAGATMTGLKSVGHELQHNYFARFVMPSNGNAGWIDEAIASWRDEIVDSRKSKESGQKSIRVGGRELNKSTANLAKHSVFQRITDKKSYTNGRDFIFYLDNLIRKVPGKNVKNFLRIYFEDRKATTITNDDFKKDLENYYGDSLNRSFNKYIYGNESKNKSLELEDNHHHPVLTEEEIMQLI